ncbi:M6 metalloprotease [Periconia macrospinosa]|uniref:M6 metalloprotease n=1 Tax=Periconia macrospinosa TaxID=97972 RepID=A0A2V1DT35_9PLEO|nr:M6 metalloprotease [Periconia macrospinosa]
MSSTTSPRMSLVALACALFNPTALAAPAPASNGHAFQRRAVVDPFAILDEQKWVNPDNMTWDDFVAPPGTTWGDTSKPGRERNFNIAMVTVDYPDSPFAVTLEANSDIFNNPLPSAAGLKREDVPKFYLDLLNTPNELNEGHTLHEYWMGDSFGKYGVNLTVFGPYRMPSLSYQYGIDDEQGGFNEGACPEGPPCSVDLRTDALGAWRRDVGDEVADAFELAFILSAGQDESSTWQEFGEMKFASPADVPDEFGPPGNSSLPNSAKTRYVSWTSWAAASTIWPNAGGGSSTQGESSGMATFAHELSHLLGIGDNYNNPYSNPARRAYTGPFSMLDRGSFNGPGGPHTRYQIPPVQGASMGSLHTMRDKHQIKLIDSTPILQVSRTALSSSGPVVAKLFARAVDPASTESGIMGFNITLDSGGDKSPACNTSQDPLCDGGAYDNYNVEVIDRMGADSFTPDSGVMISKTRNSDRRQPFQWVIDANPEDAHVVDFYYPNGTARYWSIGDYRQLVDALFHAGTRSGSQFEHIDTANDVHIYILDTLRDETGVLSYTVGISSASSSNSTSKVASPYGLTLSKGTSAPLTTASSSKYSQISACTFTLSNTGSPSNATSSASHPQDLTKYLGQDIYKLSASVATEGWEVVLPNALAHAPFGGQTEVVVGVGRIGQGGAAAEGVKVVLEGVSVGGGVRASAACVVG